MINKNNKYNKNEYPNKYKKIWKCISLRKKLPILERSS